MSEKDIKLTVIEFIDFFIDIPTNNYKNDFKVTYNYQKRRGEGVGDTGPHLELAKRFTGEKTNLIDDELFYQHLASRSFNNSSSLQKKIFSNIPVFYPIIEKNKKDKSFQYIINQKWHLFVSGYAYIETVNLLEPELFSNYDTSLYKPNCSCNLEDDLILGSTSYFFGDKNNGFPFYYGPLKLWIVEATILKLKTKNIEWDIDLNNYIDYSKNLGQQISIDLSIITEKIREYNDEQG